MPTQTLEQVLKILDGTDYSITAIRISFKNAEQVTKFLTALSKSENKNISFIELSVDLSESKELNEGLSEENVKSLVKILNQKSHVKTLQLTKCKLNDKTASSLTELQYVSSLSLKRNALTSKIFINILNTVAVQEFDFSHNVISHIGDLAKAKALRKLSIGNCGVKPMDLENLAKIGIESLDVSGNIIGNTGVKEFQKFKTLKEVYAISCGITASGAEIIAQMESLRTIDLSHNSLGVVGARYFGRDSSDAKKLQPQPQPQPQPQLQPQSANTSPRHVSTRTVSFNATTNITAAIDNASVSKTPRVLPKDGATVGAKINGSGKTLILRHCDIRGDKVDGVAMSFANNSEISRLDLTDNGITAFGASILVQKKLSYLGLAKNNIESMGSYKECFARIMIRDLDLRNNNIPDVTLLEIIRLKNELQSKSALQSKNTLQPKSDLQYLNGKKVDEYQKDLERRIAVSEEKKKSSSPVVEKPRSNSDDDLYPEELTLEQKIEKLEKENASLKKQLRREKNKVASRDKKIKTLESRLIQPRQTGYVSDEPSSGIKKGAGFWPDAKQLEPGNDNSIVTLQTLTPS